MADAQVLEQYDQSTIEKIERFTTRDMDDLCDATEAAIQDGGGFGWIDLPSRQIMERYWHGVLLVPHKDIYVAKLDGVICGAAQLIKQPSNNQLQSFNAKIRAIFVAPWARGRGFAKQLVNKMEADARRQEIEVLSFDVIETQKEAMQLFETMGFKKWGQNPLYAKVAEKVYSGHYYIKDIQNP